MKTNINIINEDNIYNYLIEYERYSNHGELYNEKYMVDEDNVIIYDSQSNFYNSSNNWNILEDNGYVLPVNNYGVAKVRVYFPEFSLDKYVNNIHYGLSINTWIGKKQVTLGTYIFKRSDALACPYMQSFGSQKYYEYIEVEVVDVYNLIYDDNWKRFRQEICLEPDSVNDLGSIIYFKLEPLELGEESYIKSIKATGGQNSINFSQEKNEDLKVDVMFDVMDYPKYTCKVKFNEVYNGDLKTYIKETYKVKDDINVRYELVIGNDKDMYLISNSDILDGNDIEYNFDHRHIHFDNANGWKEGMYVKVSLEILFGENMIYILSNEIPFTRDMLKYFVGKEFLLNNKPVYNINLDLVDMKVYNVKAFNKIENKIVKVDRPGDTKANMMQPVFFKSYQGSDIIVYPNVNHNITINLDEYKSKTNTFILQIDNQQFMEIGRVPQGVLFKIPANKLSIGEGETLHYNGTYFILNNDLDMITNGKYTYVV